MNEEHKTRYRNVSAGIQGVAIINEEGKRDAIAVRPGETVELSEREKDMTARAPRVSKDNPFVGGGPGGGPALVLDTEERPTGEVGAAVEPSGEAPEGAFKQGEEVGTPDAPEAA